MGLRDLGRLLAAGFSSGQANALQDQVTGIGASSPPSAGGGSLNPTGNIFSFAGSAGNGADTTEDTLATFALPAKALDVAGRGVYIYAFGTYANNTNTKAAKLYFGGTSQAVATGNNVSWAIEAIVMKSASNVQQINFQPVQGTTHGGTVTAAGSETDTAAITIKLTGTDSTSATANSIVLNGMFVNFMN